jgi:ankyrin repeat protein
MICDINRCVLAFLLSVFILAMLPSMASANQEIQIVVSAKERDLAQIKSLLNKSVDVNVADADGTTALHWAVHWDDRQMAELLLASGMVVDQANIYGVTPLWLACTNRSTEMVKALLKAGANPNARLSTGETVLVNCARTGAVDAVNAMLTSSSEIDVNARENKRGQTALMWAAVGGHAEIVRSLVDYGAKVDMASNGGFTPLLFAARSGDIETARILLDAGANPDEATAEQGNSLVIASAGGHEDLALLFLQKGANPDSTDENGLTALHHSVREGLSLLNGVIYDKAYRLPLPNMPKLTRALLEAGANPNVQISQSKLLGPDGIPFDMVGATPFLLAALSADVQLMRLLKEFGADAQLATNESITPLMAAAQAACTGTCAYQDFLDVAGRKDVELARQAVKMIVEEIGTDLNAMNKAGRTAMHFAAFIGSDAVVKYLAEQGALIDVRDNNGETPWTMASGISPKANSAGAYRVSGSTAELLAKLGAETVADFTIGK